MYNFINNQHNVYNLVSLSCVTLTLNQKYTSYGCLRYYSYFLESKGTGKNVFTKALIALGEHFKPSIFQLKERK